MHSCGCTRSQVLRCCAGYLPARGSPLQREQVAPGRRSADLDWPGYNLLACRKPCSSGRTEAVMRLLNSPVPSPRCPLLLQPQPVRVAAALRISIQRSIRAGPVVIAPPRRGNEAWQPLKPLPRLTVAGIFLHFFSTAPPGRGGTFF